MYSGRYYGRQQEEEEHRRLSAKKRERKREKRRGIDERTERWNSGASRSLLHDPQFTVTSRRDAVWYLPSGTSFSFSLAFSFSNIVTIVSQFKIDEQSLGIVSLRLPKCELIRLDLDNSGHNVIHRSDEFLASKLYEHAPPVTHQSNSERVRYILEGSIAPREFS